ncbi:MAG: hypothetical protein IJ520_09915 [Synergistaceae bacterium]|nr:hypothetical protein [Synergistaceae bacterium]
MLEVKVTVSMPEVAEAINNLAAALSNKPTAPKAQPAPAPVAPQPQPTPAPAPVSSVPLASAPQFTVDQIMNAGAALMDAGKIEDLMNLLHSFGVQAVMELKPEQLGAFATEMRKLGAAI